MRVGDCGVSFPKRRTESKMPVRKRKTFDVNVTTSTYKCWHDCTGCPGNGKGGVLALYRMFHSECETNKDAAKQIHSALYGDLKTGSKDYEARKAQIIKPQKEVQKTKYASPDEIDGAYRVLLSLLPLKESIKATCYPEVCRQRVSKMVCIAAFPKIKRKCMH